MENQEKAKEYEAQRKRQMIEDSIKEEIKKKKDHHNSDSTRDRLKKKKWMGRKREMAHEWDIEKKSKNLS